VGTWAVSTSAKGARIVYRCHAEIGGFIPNFIVNKGQIGNLKTMLMRVKKVLGRRLGQQ
jgi:hypothetical protein